MTRRANHDGTIYRDGVYWVAEIQWTDARGTHRLRRKRKTQYDAREALEQLRSSLRHGTVLDGASAKITVKDACERYLADASTRVRPRTLMDYARIMKSYILPRIGKKKAHTIRRIDIRIMLESIPGDRQKQLTYVIAKAILTPYVRGAEPAEYPFPPRSSPRVAKREPLAFALDDIRTFITRVQNEPLAPIYVLAIATGLRESEILGLRWSDVHADHLEIHGSLDEHTRERAETKTGKTRRVDIPPAVADVLESHRKQLAYRSKPSDLIFRNQLGRPIQAALLRRSWRTTRTRLGLDPSVRIYDLRHAHATALLAGGVHPKIVQERLGHSSIRLTMDTYSHVMPGMQSQALETITSLFGDPNEKLAPPKTPPKASRSK